MLDSFFPASGAQFVDGHQFSTFENVVEAAAEDRCMQARGWKVAMPITTRANIEAESDSFEDDAIWPNLGWIRAHGMFVAPGGGGSQVGLMVNATSRAEQADDVRCIATSEAPMQAFVNTVRPLSGTWINTILQLQQSPRLAGDRAHLSSCLTKNGASTRGARSLNSFLAYWVQSAISAQPRGADRIAFEHRWVKIFVHCATPLITAEQNVQEKSRKAFSGGAEVMSRRRPILAVVVALAVALALAAGFISRGFVITAPVRRGTLPVEVVLRATVAHPDPVAISAPASLGADPVVTSVGVRVGEAVSDGSLLGTVAERPVFVMVGRVPAFRTITPGTSGVDVRQLQQGLITAGYGIGSDTAGTYGPGTAAAVLALYHARGVQPDVSSGAVGALTAARAQAAAASRRLASASGRRLPAARSADTEARAALAQAEIAAEASVPLGEVVFVPRLPARVLSHASLGSTVGQGGATGVAATTGGSRSHAAPTLAVIGSSQVTLTATTGRSDASQLRSGMRGTAISDLSSTRLRVRLRAADAHKLTVLPLGRVPTGLLGQSVEIDVVANRVRSLIVPISAVSTDPTGRTYLTVVGASQRLRTVYVHLGYSTGGRQAVTAHGLRSGEPVMIGRQL